jgi:hypothetical protein
MVMNRILLENITPNEAIDFKLQLVRDGLVQDQDFCWAYRQAYNDNFSSEIPKHAIFDFADGATATFYQLKWIKT